jgi:hypothetical protein
MLVDVEEMEGDEGVMVGMVFVVIRWCFIEAPRRGLQMSSWLGL